MLLFKGNSVARPITLPCDDLSADPRSPTSSAECAYFCGPPLMPLDMFGSLGGCLTISMNLHERAFRIVVLPLHEVTFIAPRKCLMVPQLQASLRLLPVL